MFQYCFVLYLSIKCTFPNGAGIGWQHWRMKGNDICPRKPLSSSSNTYFIHIYYRAEQGDYSVIEELTALLEDPYSNTPYRPPPTTSTSTVTTTTSTTTTAETVGPTAKDSGWSGTAAAAEGAGASASASASSGDIDPAIREAGSSCGVGVEDKWYRKAPVWARNMPGVAFMSCSS